MLDESQAECGPLNIDPVLGNGPIRWPKYQRPAGAPGSEEALSDIQ